MPKEKEENIRMNRNPMRTLKRLFSYMFQNYKFYLVLVFVLIILSTYANVRGSLFLQVVIDDYITPLLGVSNPNFSGLLKAITTMGLIYAVRIIIEIETITTKVNGILIESIAIKTLMKLTTAASKFGRL